MGGNNKMESRNKIYQVTSAETMLTPGESKPTVDEKLTRNNCQNFCRLGKCQYFGHTCRCFTKTIQHLASNSNNIIYQSGPGIKWLTSRRKEVVGLISAVLALIFIIIIFHSPVKVSLCIRVQSAEKLISSFYSMFE